MTDLNHLHPRHLRNIRGNVWKPTPPKRLHRTLVPVAAGTSQAKPLFTYAAAMENAMRYPSRALQLKRERLAIGFTRREYDQYRDQRRRENAY